jgi:hypothetical protein
VKSIIDLFRPKKKTFGDFSQTGYSPLAYYNGYSDVPVIADNKACAIQSLENSSLRNLEMLTKEQQMRIGRILMGIYLDSWCHLFDVLKAEDQFLLVQYQPMNKFDPVAPLLACNLGAEFNAHLHHVLQFLANYVSDMFRLAAEYDRNNKQVYLTRVRKLSPVPTDYYRTEILASGNICCNIARKSNKLSETSRNRFIVEMLETMHNPARFHELYEPGSFHYKQWRKALAINTDFQK